MGGFLREDDIIHTINDVDEETENVTYTTPEPYIIQLQENDNFRMFTVTSCIRESLIHKPRFNKPNSYIYTLPYVNYTPFINLRIKDTDYQNVKVNLYPDLTDKIIMSTMVKNEDDYIIQWIEYHLSLGIQHFIIYDNKDTPKWLFPSKSSSLHKESDLESLLDNYIKKGVVILLNWPYLPELGFGGLNSGQHTQLNHCLNCFKESKYLCNFDVDEYINPQHFQTLESQLNYIIEKNDVSLNNLSCFKIEAKFFHNFKNKCTNGYNFLKITNCEKSTRKNKCEKLIIIPKNTYTIGPHMVFRGNTPMLSVSENDMFCNHYFFLNKEERGREVTRYTDESILSKKFFMGDDNLKYST